MSENEKIKTLCLSLLHADTEDEIIRILKEAGYWDDSSAWRYYGDNENNYSTIGNQQSRPDAALVEKIVNAADARLMNECMVRGIDPESENAPKNIREAISLFFEDITNLNSETAGNISEWAASKRTEVARGITLSATGYRPREGKPCFSIADSGEGQTPDLIPETFLSLHRSNKLRIPFVQGKFNMGGTGALKFCGSHNLEFILTRRNPLLLNGNISDDDKTWGFTVVRREDPKGRRRSSVYTYLAPVQIKGQLNGVLRFRTEAMPIFPERQNPYSKSAQWGTLLKLYEYSATGYYNTHMFRKDGLQGRLDILLPDVALPVRLHECRNFKGSEERSFETTLTGLGVRLSDDKAKNLEKDFPCSCPIGVSGEELTATIYAFKKGKADTYRKNEGVIFTVNGQTHGHLTRDFFRRKKIGLSYIADSILVVINCNNITGRAREDLFMNSRDRLSGCELRKEIEQNLIELLSKHDGLRELKNRRRDEEIQSKLDNSKPLEDILESLLKQSPTLASLFLHGNRIANPFKTKHVSSSNEEYIGKKYPTFFKFKGKEPGTVLQKNCHINYRCRIAFETDAENNYFGRKIERGNFTLHIKNQKNIVPVYVGPNLQNGIGTLSVQLPKECQVGDIVEFVAQTTDVSRIEPFINQFNIKVMEPAIPNGGKSKRRKPPIDEDGKERDLPSGIALPKITQVKEENWSLYEPPFNKYTALRVIHAGKSTTDEKKDIYDFYVNMDNTYFKADMKVTSADLPLVEARYTYGMALLGLAILHDSEKTAEQQDNNNENDDQNIKNIEDVVESVTQAIAPILLPMIDGLGALDITDIESFSTAGEAD